MGTWDRDLTRSTSHIAHCLSTSQSKLSSSSSTSPQPVDPSIHHGRPVEVAQRSGPRLSLTRVSVVLQRPPKPLHRAHNVAVSTPPTNIPSSLLPPRLRAQQQTPHYTLSLSTSLSRRSSLSSSSAPELSLARPRCARSSGLNGPLMLRKRITCRSKTGGDWWRGKSRG